MPGVRIWWWGKQEKGAGEEVSIDDVLNGTKQWSVTTGDALELLQIMPDKSVQCCVTSPPYWGLRDYGISGQIGLEETPEEYVNRLVEVFREAWRVLRDDGTLWLVIRGFFFKRKTQNRRSIARRWILQ